MLPAAQKTPVGKLPILIGGSGEKVTLRLVAEHAHAWNAFGPPKNYARLNGVLDEWCAKVGRDPEEIERTVAIDAGDVKKLKKYVKAGATHVILMLRTPFDLRLLQTMIDQRDDIGEF